MRGELAASDKQILLTAAVPLIDHRYEMTGVLADAAWILRDNFTFYDALYVALAQALTCPLLIFGSPVESPLVTASCSRSSGNWAILHSSAA